jgi:hypothetical protein
VVYVPVQYDGQSTTGGVILKLVAIDAIDTRGLECRGSGLLRV